LSNILSLLVGYVVPSTITKPVEIQRDFTLVIIIIGRPNYLKLRNEEKAIETGDIKLNAACFKEITLIIVILYWLDFTCILNEFRHHENKQ
jgi:hypothetical protein